MIAPVTRAPTALERALLAFRAELGGDPALIARAPGRVNLLGEHVDYNDGFVLPIAIDRDVVVAAAPRPDATLRVLAIDRAEEDTFLPTERFPRASGWSSYVRGVARLLGETGVRIPGATLVIAGDVPQSAGLSSSAALEVSVASALLGLARQKLPDMQLIELCHRAELEFAGVSCGIMDQFVAVCGEPGRALFLDCRHLVYAQLPLPAAVRLVALDSGVRRELRNSEYNERVRECREAAGLLGVRSLRDVPAGESERDIEALPEPLMQRARHVVTEIQRTRQAAAALERGDLAQVGELMRESHISLRDDYEVSIEPLDVLVEAANEVTGVIGSRLSGAGFGGCTLSLVHEDALDDFRAQVLSAYERRTGRHATMHVLRPGPGAALLADWGQDRA
jgi:galactokinase